jgi:hypothetical protein
MKTEHRNYEHLNNYRNPEPGRRRDNYFIFIYLLTFHLILLYITINHK